MQPSNINPIKQKASLAILGRLVFFVLIFFAYYFLLFSSFLNTIQNIFGLSQSLSYKARLYDLIFLTILDLLIF
jgi:hypothetical protein